MQTFPMGVQTFVSHLQTYVEDSVGRHLVTTPCDALFGQYCNAESRNFRANLGIFQLLGMIYNNYDNSSDENQITSLL